MFVITADQKQSRRTGDRVPAALAMLSAELHGPGLTLAFERTAGDEIQGVIDRAELVPSVVSSLTRLGGWRIGIGIGEVDRPLPRSTRAGSGPAFVAAREAVRGARSAPQDLAVRRAIGATSYAQESAQRAEAALWMLVSVLARRTDQGWKTVDVMSTGLSGVAAAQQLGISASAVSQRIASAGLHEAGRGASLAAWLLEEAAR